MASPRVMRRKMSLPMLRTPSRSRKTSSYGNRLDIDHLNSQSHMAFLRKVSVNPNEIMYPINVTLPTGQKQVVVLSGTSKLRDILDEVGDLLDDEIESYALEISGSNNVLSLTSPSVDFVGKHLQVIKDSKKYTIEEKQETGRKQFVKDLCSSEKQYRDRIHYTEVIYRVPLKSWGLNEAQICLLFDGTIDAEIASNNIINKLEQLLIDWDNETSCISGAFDNSFWQTHENSINFYNLAKLTLKSKRENNAFNSFVNMQRSVTGKPTLEALILAPLQRVPQYDSFMTELILATPPEHCDRKGIEKTAARLKQLSEKRHEILQKEEQELKIINVQEKFPHDKLDLDLSWTEYERLKYRRFNSPSLRHKKGTVLDLDLDKRSPTDDLEPYSPTSPTSTNNNASNVKRVYIQEGPVKLSNATSTNDRYLFLFNDLLLVAKPKSTTTFKLKERIRVSEVWLSNCIDEVTEATVTHEKSFVIGWPSINYVASFNLIEEKDIWYKSLKKNIAERRDCEEPKEITIKIANKTQPEDVQPTQTCSVTVTCEDEARSVVKSSLEQFQQQNEDPNEYQLMILAKDGTGYPLIGHELPYAIRMNHIRTLHEYTHDENDNQYEHAALDDDGKIQFVLKKVKKGSSRNNLVALSTMLWYREQNIEYWKPLEDLDLANQKKKKIKKSPIINWAMNKKTVKQPYMPQPQDSLPLGKLFRHPLTNLATEENAVPKPVQDILVQLFRRGPGTSGIFRKSALQRTTKQIRQMLDEGKEVDFEDASAIVLASVLKEFFRSLPESLIVSDIYEGFSATKHISDLDAKIEETKTILRQMPKAHYDLLMRFLCVLYHIQRFSDRNKMTSHNLAICVSPSIMFLPVNFKMATATSTGDHDIVAFLIENYVKLFSSENEYCLGEESEIQLDDEHGEDSDSGADQVIYKYEDVEDREEEETEPVTPDFLLSPVDDRETIFSHSDSSLNTNDSDEMKSGVKLNIPQISLGPGSKSSPNSPIMGRKKDDKTLSDYSDQEGHENELFQRRLLRQPRPKRMLSSTTKSAELIEHKRHLSDSNASIASSDVSNDSPHSLTSSSTLISQKHVISQPIIQHFAPEYRPTPNVIFHAVDRRRQPAAPSYEEHIQRTQSKSKIVKATSKRQPVVAHTTLVQHQSVPTQDVKGRPQDLFVHVSPKGSISASTSFNSISSISSNEEKRTSTLTRRARVKKAEKPVISPKSPKAFFAKEPEFKPEPAKKKITQEEDSMIQELLNNLQESITPMEEQVFATPFQTEAENIFTPSSNDSSPTSKDKQNSKDDIENTFNSIMDSLHHNVALNGNYTERKKNSERTNSISINQEKLVDEKKQRTPPPVAPKPIRRTPSKSSGSNNKELPTTEELESLSSILSSFSDTLYSPVDGEVFLVDHNMNTEVVSTSQSPFSLTLKNDQKKSPQSSQTDDSKTKSLVLEKTLLTKAPKKIDQLTLTHERREDPANSRPRTARELRRANRRIRSEVRTAFNDGSFSMNVRDKPSPETSYKQVTLKNFTNNHIKSRALSDPRENEIPNKENLPTSPLNLANLLEVSRQRYTENSSKTKDDCLDNEGLLSSIEKGNTDSDAAAYAEIMAQTESYV